MSSTVGLQVSAPVGIQVAPYSTPGSKGIAPPPFPAQAAVDISPKPKPADVEDVRLGYKFQMQEIRIGTHSTAESKVARGPASLVGSL